MYISFDYKCHTCHEVRSLFVKKTEMDKQMCSCKTITPMTRLPAGTRTTFRFADSKLKD